MHKVMAAKQEKDRSSSSEIVAILDFYQSDLHKEAKRILEDQIRTEEAVLCAEQRIWHAADWLRLQPIENLKALILIVARNAAKSLQKTGDYNFNPLGENQDVILRELEKKTFPHLPKLRSNYQDVIVLKYYYELPNQAIGELLGISEKNVQIRIFRAKQRIREFVEHEMYL